MSEIFRSRPEGPWGPPSLLFLEYRLSFPRIKRPGRGVDHPPPSIAEVKERVEMCLLALWAFVVCFRVNIMFIPG